MPILNLQMRMRQLGEIRIGHVVAGTSKAGKAYTRPAKLNAFRFTSPSREILTSIAELYGGEVTPWTPANGGPSEFEVFSKAKRLPVLIPPRDAVNQWYELYAGSKCMRRCDGVTEHKADKPCMCNPDKRDCSITTRVNVMLRDVPALGQWLLVSKGYYAAVTLPPAAELLAQAGGYVSGWLGMEEKLVVRDDVGTTRFMIPTLDVEITPAALMAGNITGGPAVEAGPERVAITGGRPDYAALAAVAKTSADVGALWKQAVAAKHMDDGLAALLKARGEALTPKTIQTPNVPEQGGTAPNDPERYDDDGQEEVHDAEIVDDDLTELWFLIMAAAGPRGWTTEDTEQRFAKAHSGLMPATASPAQLRTFLAGVKAGDFA